MTEPSPNPAGSAPPAALTARQRARLAIIGFSIGVGALLLGTPLLPRLASLVAHVDAAWVRATLAMLTLAVPVLVVAPAAAFGAGLILGGPRWLLACSIAAGTQTFPTLAAWLAPVASPSPAARVLQALLAAAVGAILCAMAIGSGQRLARKLAARKPQAEGSRLAAIDFNASKDAPRPDPVDEGRAQPRDQG